jgi:hypothetical protein
MGLIWYPLIFLAGGALCSLAMIWISDHLQHGETRVSSIRMQDILQYQLDILTAPHNRPAGKPKLAQGPVGDLHQEEHGDGPEPEPVVEGRRAAL